MGRSISPELISGLIDCIYASATDPGAWPVALNRINQAIKCRASVIGMVSFEQDFSLVNATAGFDEGFAARYATNLSGLSEIWGGDQQIAARPIHEPVVLSLHHPQALRRGSAQHELLCEVLGFEVEDTANMPLAHFGRAIGATGFARQAGEGQFERDLLRIFRLLSPHIQRSADINRLLDAQALSVALRDGLMNRLRSAVVIVDRRMRLVQANDLAIAIGGIGGEKLHAQSGMLGPRELVESATEVVEGRSAYRCVILRDWPANTSHLVHVMPLSADGDTSLSGYAALVFSPSHAVDAASLESIAGQYGLTDAETSVLQQLFLGKSSGEIAATLGLRPSTVRTHSLRIFEKFDVHHRAELVARLNAITSPFAGPLHQTVDAQRI